jgi:hypothetical protein
VPSAQRAAYATAGAQGEVRLFAAEVNVSSKGVVESAMIVPQGRYCVDGPCCRWPGLRTR